MQILERTFDLVKYVVTAGECSGIHCVYLDEASTVECFDNVYKHLTVTRYSAAWLA